ncbi:hypothetical protein EIP86_001311 [Pleurotus ostreatoroseus]|nr:hypothetical protein EIP86_001311 [Pleurotus ostreatoroseus]
MESTNSTVQFKSTSPALTLRYDIKAFADRATKSGRTIEPGLEPRGSIPLPQRWSTYVHPEGSRYFVYDSAPRIVTDTYMSTQTEFDGFLAEFITPFQDFLKEHDLVPHEEMEVYLRKGSYPTCGYYYLVDHARQRISWLESVTTYDMDFLGVTSDSNLELVLQHAYWTHVSYFPCHKATGFNQRREELINNLLSFRVDDIMSSTACVLYRSKQCEQLVDSIQNLEVGSPDETWVIGRLWAQLLNERVLNGYGEETARIGSDQLFHKVVITEPSRVYKLLSKFLFRLPDIYRNILVDKLWRDSTVPGSQWSFFWDKLRWEWSMCLVVAA